MSKDNYINADLYALAMPVASSMIIELSLAYRSITNQLAERALEIAPSFSDEGEAYKEVANQFMAVCVFDVITRLKEHFPQSAEFLLQILAGQQIIEKSGNSTIN